MLNASHLIGRLGLSLLLACSAMWASPAQCQVLAMAPDRNSGSEFPVLSSNGAINREEIATDNALESLHRQVVRYQNDEAPGTIIVDTPHTFLYYVLDSGTALRYGIGVGRKGFTWSGVKTIIRKSEWPDWYPPREMIARQPYLPRMIAGGPGNPLGARALYIGGTEFRIHGTNNPSSIGKHMSSGCIRMTNDNIIDLYDHVKIGAKVIVLPMPLPHVSSRTRRFPSIEPTPRTKVVIHSPNQFGVTSPSKGMKSGKAIE